MLSSLNDTISAIITPVGEGGIAVIRLSGKRSIEIVSGLFRGHTDLASVSSHTVHVGFFVNENNEAVDEVVVTVFRSPRSYTTEDSVEISCHGSMFIARKILNSCIKKGARHAEPGEFTKRAFLHGRIDLAQAEAVAALIHSHSEAAHRASFIQLRGMYTNFFTRIHDELVSLCGLLELDLDFTEESISIIETSTCVDKLQAIYTEMSRLIETYEYGKIVRDGIKVVLVGKPNVGKSSILNALLNQNRSIVTEISGTTRDTIEELIAIDGLKFRLVDSAGIRSTSDLVESEGIKRTYNEIEQANVIAYVIDATDKSLQCEHQTIESIISRVKKVNSQVILVINKIDLLTNREDFVLPNSLSNFQHVFVSAKQSTGIEELKKAIHGISFNGISNQASEDITITNSRHIDSLTSALEGVKNAINSAKSRVSNEFIVIDIRKALHALEEITGQVTNDSILNRIFAGFCIGK